VRSPGVFLSVSPTTTRNAVLFLPTYIPATCPSRLPCLTNSPRESQPACRFAVCEQREAWFERHRVINDGKRTGLVFTNEGQRGGNVHANRPRVLALCHRCTLQLVVTVRAETGISWQQYIERHVIKTRGF